MPLDLRPAVHDGATFERHTVYGGDDVWLRVVDAGDVEVIEYHSEDRDGGPAHHHPWDEIEYVIDGEVEFLVGDTTARGGAGTVQVLPAGTPHRVRIPEGRARILMITVGAPYAGFARDVSALGTAGAPPLADLLAIAHRHGLRIAGGGE